MNMFNKLKLKWKLVTGFALPLILLVIIATTVNVSISKLLKTQGWVGHTHEVVAMGNDIISSLVNMETGLRGYLITGNSEFLEPYNEGTDKFSDLINASKNKVSDNPSQVERLSKIERLESAWKQNHVEIAMNIRRDVNSGTAKPKEITAFIDKAIGKQYMDQMRGHLTAFIAAEAVLIKIRKDEQKSTADTTTSITIFGTIIALILGGLAAVIIIRNLISMLGGEPSYAIEVVSKIATGDLDTQVDTLPGDTSSLLYSMKIMRENLLNRATEDEKLTAETTRIKLALDVCDTNVMVADSEYNIIYMNDAVHSMMETAEADLKQDLPNFNAQKLMHSNIDVFHKKPAHQRSLLEGLRDTYRTDIKVGSRTFGLIATPIFDEKHNRLGTAVEWDDKTERLAKEISDKAIADTNAQIKMALDVCDTNVMMANADYNISYMNQAVGRMMNEANDDLRQDLPNFDANKLMGKNIDVFHKNPAHQRGMLEKLKDVYRTDIKVGGRTFGLTATPIYNSENERLGTVVEWDDKTERLAKEIAERKLANENAGIKLALDVCNTNVMMADNEYNINYMNAAVQNMMKVAESDLRVVLPRFDANNLIGNNIDVFHKNPAHQRQMLGHLQTPYETEIKVGARTFGLIATPIFSSDKERLGTVVEWNDRTAEVALEVEVDTLINAANEGNLKTRIDLNGKSGFFEALSKGLNSLMDKTSAFVSDVGDVFEAMSDGNLTETITNNYQGELQDIKNNANNSIMKLTEVLAKIQTASETVRMSSTEVAEGSDDLSRRTESQASSLEETASSMEEITAAVKQSADNSSESSSLANDAKLKAQQGGDVVQGAVTAMREIMESSNKINDIIGVIDEIAFQTNLLALNAAVEAARAGEQGRGFAVVAGEVRTLSQRSAAAAKEIKDLIRDSVNKVESGSALVNQSGQMLSDIVKAVDNVAIMINDVNTAAIEQNSGISQINQAVAQMDEMTQQNAALVEETSAASRSMSEEATNMNRLISFFRLSNSGHNTAYSAQTNAPDPIITYQTNTSPTPKAKASDNSNDAASFSSKDDWEDF